MRYLELLFIVALVLYTVAIFSHKFKGELERWMISVFGLGLLADISGTLFLCILHSKGWKWNLHTISGLAALVIMALHFGWALLAKTKVQFNESFEKYSLYAWCLWILAFVSGIPL